MTEDIKYQFPTIKGFIRVTNSRKDGCVYLRNNGFGTIDQILVHRENVRIIGGEDEPLVWKVIVAANLMGKWEMMSIDETIESLAEQINNN